ncbi:MAG: chaperone modulator CbpM [Casimicrobiaceae bacterium]
MNRELCEAMHLDAHGQLSLHQLEELSGLAEGFLRELVDYGAFEPLDTRGGTWTFTSEVVVMARMAGRLHRDFELDAHALTLLLRMVERVQTLEGEVRALRAGRLP